MHEIVFGLDFGTSNSAVAALINGDPTLLPLGSDGQESIPTLLYFPGTTEQYFIGFEAIDKYIAAGMSGRFLQSIKSLLPDSGFAGTAIAGWGHATAEDLAFCFLSAMKKGIDLLFPSHSASVVIGRPAVFGADSIDDKCAQDRLLGAARRAGFANITFQFEPVAAALTYEHTLRRTELAFIADLGGGTSDFTIMKLAPQGARRVNRSKDILATGGVYLAGDALNSAIMRAKVTPHFGEGSTYETYKQRLEVPRDFYRTISRWEQLSLLKNSTQRDRIERYIVYSDNPEAFHRLQRLIDHNLGYALFRSIDAAKCHLSTHDEAIISFHECDIDIEEKITRPEFELISHRIAGEIEEAALDTLTRAGIQPHEIDSVFITGGTSRVPHIRNIFARIFGPEKLREGDAFLSVATGLALSAPSPSAST